MQRPFVPAFFAVLSAASAAHAAGVSKGPWVQHVGTTSAVVRVEVDPPAPIAIEVSGGSGAASRTVTDGDKTALHSVALDGLAPATRYTYTVRGPGEAKAAAFTTAPSDSRPFHFLIYGDNRTDDAAHAAVVRAMVPVKSDFLINTGDFVESGDVPSDWQSFFDIEAPLLRERCLFSCVGNHEITDGAGTAYIRYFGPNAIAGAPAPEQLQGTFRWSNTRFFLVNGMVPYRTGPDRSWLDRVLRDADDEKGLVWRIVVVHHGPWSSGPHGDNRQLAQAGIPALLREHKVDLVVAGHDHIYERGVAEGMAYLVSGGGGAPPYRIKAPRSSARKVESARHFIDAAVTETTIQLTATRADASILERCALRKAGGWDCDGDSTPGAAASASPPREAREPAGSSASANTTATTTTTTPAASSRCACRAAGAPGSGSSGSSFAPALAAVAALSGIAMRLAMRRALVRAP